MPEFLLLRLEGPLQAWGDVAFDPKRPTAPFPTRSALAGLLASALGWRYRDGARTNRLQDALRFAIRQDRAPRRLEDYQTVDLGRETSAWTRWGVERRGGAFSTGTHILEKEYLADGSFLVALTLREPGPVTLDALADALRFPARPLHLGRKSCPPATPLLEGRVHADTPYAALAEAPLDDAYDAPPLVCWYEPGDGPAGDEHVRSSTQWHRRDFVTDRFAGSRVLLQGAVTPAGGATTEAAT